MNRRRRTRTPTIRVLPRSLQWDALGVAERLSLLRVRRIRSAATLQSIRAAREMIERALPVDSRAAVAGWLASEGVPENDFPAALRYPKRLASLSFKPNLWQDLLLHVLDPSFIRAGFSDQPAEPRDGVFCLLRPFTFWARQELLDPAFAWPRVWVRDRVAPCLINLLLRRLVQSSRRTLYLAINVDRMNGVLLGSAPEERLASFRRRYSADPARLRRLFLRYPVLSRLLAVLCLSWRRNITALITAYQRDRKECVSKILEGRDPGNVTGIYALGSDPHNHGAEVLLLVHEAGKLIFKPRSLEVDQAFQKVVEWLNSQGVSPQLRPLRVVTNKSRGWMEYVEHDGTDAAGAERFYFRQGVYLALLHLLYATDLHAENLIAAGEHPYLIDLEAVLHARPELGRIPGLAERALAESVMRVGLLPSWFASAADRPGVDISGLGNPEGQHYGRDADSIDDTVADEPRIVRRRVAVDVKKNRAAVGGVPADVCDYEGALVAGFQSAAALVLSKKDEFLAVLETFQEVEVRQVLRPTIFYADALSKAAHPDYLRDGVAQDLFYSRLWVIGLHQDMYKRIALAELRDLREGDVPKFTTTPTSMDLRDSTGAVIKAYNSVPAMQRARARIVALTSGDIARQVTIIHSSLVGLRQASSRTTQKRSTPGPRESLDPGSGVLPAEAFVAEAVAIGRELVSLAIEEDGVVDWLTLKETRDQLHIVPAGTDVYSGSSGIALFLAYLDSVRATDEFRPFCRRIVESLRIAIRSQELDWGGAFCGLGSTLYALHHIAVLTRDATLFADVLEAAKVLVQRTDDVLLDLLSGSAGLLRVLLGLYRESGERFLLDGAIRFGEKLRDTSQRQESGVGWQRPWIDSTAPLTGASHGAAGISWALLHLEAVTSQTRFGEIGRAGLVYEDSVYSEAEKNWPDFRVSLDQERPTSVPFQWAWCHGAPGILLTRVTLPAKDVLTRKTIEVLDLLAAMPLAECDCICHGELGNVEALVVAGRRWRRPEYLLSACRRASAVLRRRIRDGRWRCSVANETLPGMFLGLAGMGFQLLRITHPDVVPSILSVAPPRGHVRL